MDCVKIVISTKKYIFDESFYSFHQISSTMRANHHIVPHDQQAEMLICINS